MQLLLYSNYSMGMAGCTKKRIKKGKKGGSYKKGDRQLLLHGNGGMSAHEKLLRKGGDFGAEGKGLRGKF